MTVTETKAVKLPQYTNKKNGNPFDTLWYLSIEMAREALAKAARINCDIGNSPERLLEKYNDIYDRLKLLSEEERDFLLKDSYFGDNRIYAAGVNDKLMELADLSGSEMSRCFPYKSEAYLKATLGEEDGDKQYKYIQKIIKFNNNYNDKVVGYLVDNLHRIKSYRRDAQVMLNEFKAAFNREMSREDIEFMFDLKTNNIRTWKRG